MRSALPPLGPPVSRDRVIASFPKWYTSDACLQLKEHFHGQVSAACQLRSTGTVGCECELFSLRPQLVSLLHPSCPAFPAVSGSNSPRWSSSGTSTWGRPALSTGFVRTFLIVTTKPPSGWTLKSSASKSPESPTASRFIIMTFDLCDMQTLEHTRQWLQDALRENEPGSSFLFLVGTKKDLLPGAACEQVEAEAVRLAGEMQAEYWSVSAKTGENVTAFFSRVAALAFEQSVLQELARRDSVRPQLGDGALIRMEGCPSESQGSKKPSSLGCC
ncbi:ras-related protein Rab-36 isoform X1 [Tamandua tetradactyla]|uniref:ras-related protein Rab-36 isoform X1 n=1 Tax=Tamandua tetradactyla TaxID=48850 RepID=UPI004053C5D3